MTRFVQDLKQRALHLVEYISGRRNDITENACQDGKKGKPVQKPSMVIVESVEIEEKPTKVETVAGESVEIKEETTKVVIESVEIKEKPDHKVEESVEIKEDEHNKVVIESVEIKEKPDHKVEVVVESMEIKEQHNTVAVGSVEITSEKVEITERAYQVTAARGATRRSATRGGNPKTG